MSDDIEKFLRRSELVNQLLDFIKNNEDVPEEFLKVLEDEWEELLDE